MMNRPRVESWQQVPNSVIDQQRREADAKAFADKERAHISEIWAQMQRSRVDALLDRYMPGYGPRSASVPAQPARGPQDIARDYGPGQVTPTPEPSLLERASQTAQDVARGPVGQTARGIGESLLPTKMIGQVQALSALANVPNQIVQAGVSDVMQRPGLRSPLDVLPGAGLAARGLSRVAQSVPSDGNDPVSRTVSFLKGLPQGLETAGQPYTQAVAGVGEQVGGAAERMTGSPLVGGIARAGVGVAGQLATDPLTFVGGGHAAPAISEEVRRLAASDPVRATVKMLGEIHTAAGPALGRLATEETGALRLPTEGIEQIRGVRQAAEEIPRPPAARAPDWAQLPPRLQKAWESVGTYRYANMLSGISTHIANVTGNTINLGLQVAERPIAGAVDRLAVTAFGGQRSRYVRETPQLLRGALEGAVAGLEDVGHILKTGVDPVKAELPHRGLGTPIPALNTAVELPLRLLSAADVVFRTAGLGANARALAYRTARLEGKAGAALRSRADEIVANIHQYPDLLKAADRQAAAGVFQETHGGRLGQLERSIQSMARIPGLDLVLPFVKTPTNIIAQGLGLTPASFVRALVAARRGERGAAVDSVAKGVLGSSLIGLGYHLAGQGLVNGARPTSRSERSTLPPGWAAWSVRVAGPDGQPIDVPLASLGAAGVPLALGAALHGTRGGDAESGLASAVGMASEYVINQTFAEDIGRLADVLTGKPYALQNLAGRVAGQFVPLGGVARTVQKVAGEPYRDAQGIGEAVASQVPILSRTLPPSRTALGDPQRPGITGPLALAAPSGVSVERDEPVLAALRDAGVGIPQTPTKWKGQTLSRVDQDQLSLDIGGAIRARVGALIEDPAYQKLAPAQQADVLGKALEKARSSAIDNYLASGGRANTTTATESGDTQGPATGNKEVADEYTRLQAAGADAAPVQRVGRTIRGIKLTDAEYTEYEALVRQTVDEMLGEVITDPSYQKMPPKAQAKTLEKFEQRARDQAAKTYLRQLEQSGALKNRPASP